MLSLLDALIKAIKASVTFRRKGNVILLVFQPCYLLGIQQSNSEFNCLHGMSWKEIDFT